MEGILPSNLMSADQMPDTHGSFLSDQSLGALRSCGCLLFMIREVDSGKD